MVVVDTPTLICVRFDRPSLMVIGCDDLRRKGI
jgi:hypothetical protein